MVQLRCNNLGENEVEAGSSLIERRSLSGARRIFLGLHHYFVRV